MPKWCIIIELDTHQVFTFTKEALNMTEAFESIWDKYHDFKNENRFERVTITKVNHEFPESY